MNYVEIQKALEYEIDVRVDFQEYATFKQSTDRISFTGQFVDEDSFSNDILATTNSFFVAKVLS